MSKSEFLQKGAKVGRGGSLLNQIMSHNATVPVVGGYTNELRYTDRESYLVVEVGEEDGKPFAKLEHLDRRVIDSDGKGGGTQVFEPNGQVFTLWYLAKNRYGDITSAALFIRQTSWLPKESKKSASRTSA